MSSNNVEWLRKVPQFVEYIRRYNPNASIELEFLQAGMVRESPLALMRTIFDFKVNGVKTGTLDFDFLYKGTVRYEGTIPKAPAIERSRQRWGRHKVCHPSEETIALEYQPQRTYDRPEAPHRADGWDIPFP